MNREIHVRFWEGLGVRFPRATHCCAVLNGLLAFLGVVLSDFVCDQIQACQVFEFEHGSAQLLDFGFESDLMLPD